MEKEILYRFFSNQAPLEQERVVLDWLDLSPEHTKEMIAERKIFDALLMHAPVEVPAKRSLFALPRWTNEMLRYAAIIILVVGVSAFYVTDMRRDVMQATNTISVPAGQRVDVVLPDGTKVCMNALSKLQYPAYFAGHERKVKLTGEAFFDVVHDEDHPFIVQTYACDVLVLGTKFDVEAHPERNEFFTSLVEGEVKITDKNNINNVVTLAPNQQVAYRDGYFIVSDIPAHESFMWREGIISFRNAAFMDLIHQFEKYYGLKIEVLNRNNVPKSVFTGKIRISEGVNHALWVLQQNSAFTYVRNESKDIIYIN